MTQQPYDHSRDEYVPDAPTHRGRLALYNMIDLIEDLVNGDDRVGDWLDAALWASEVAGEL